MCVGLSPEQKLLVKNKLLPHNFGHLYLLLNQFFSQIFFELFLLLIQYAFAWMFNVELTSFYHKTTQNALNGLSCIFINKTYPLFVGFCFFFLSTKIYLKKKSFSRYFLVVFFLKCSSRKTVWCINWTKDKIRL